MVYTPQSHQIAWRREAENSTTLIGKCACYYVLPELEAILAIGTPFLLFVNAVKKLEMVHRAPLVGDYLYYQQSLGTHS